MTYGSDPGSGGSPSYGSPSEPPRSRRRPVGWLLAALAVLVGILFLVYSCGDRGPGTVPPTPTPVVYPTATSTIPVTPTPTTPYSAVVPPTVVTDSPPTYDPPTYDPPDVTTTRPPVTTTASPPTRVDAGSGGGADAGRRGTIGLVGGGLLLAGVGLTVLLRGRRYPR